MLNVELQYKELSDTTNKEELISKLKSKIAILSDELRIANEKEALLQDEVNTLKKDLEEAKKKQKKTSTEEIGSVSWKL